MTMFPLPVDVMPPMYTPGWRVRTLALECWIFLVLRTTMVLGSGGGMNRSGSGVGGTPVCISPENVAPPAVTYPGLVPVMSNPLADVTTLPPLAFAAPALFELTMSDAVPPTVTRPPPPAVNAASLVGLRTMIPLLIVV